MRLQPMINSTKGLKKNTYTILKKYHDLERTKKAPKLYSIMMNQDHYVILVIQHIKNVMEITFEDAKYRDIHIEVYLRQLDVFIDILNNCVSENKKIKSTIIPDFLKFHTNLFNYLLQRGIKIKYNDNLNKEWNKCMQAYIAVWGNNI